jgi:hypothetical protein
MQTTRTEPRIKKERVAVYVSLGLAFAAIAAIVPLMSTTAFAQPEDPDCWGDVTKALAETDEGAVGDHANDFAGEPRVGLANALDPEDQPPIEPDHPSEVGEALDFFVGEDTCPD